MHLLDGRTDLGLYMDKTIYCIASNNEISLTSSSAKDVQVRVVNLTDLLPNL